MKTKISSFKKHLQNEVIKVSQKSRLYDSDGDINDGAAHEYIGEIRSIIEVIDRGGSEQEIKDACDSVGQSYVGWL